MEKAWYLIIDTAGDGFYNMAKDEMLLRLYEKRGIPLFRVYKWNSPFVSLGFSQDACTSLNLELCRRLGVGVVRRITGGAAILHHNELTYSLVCSPEDLGLSRNVKESFRQLNAFLIEFYARIGFKAVFSFSDADGKYLRDNFCFASREKFDILVDGKKIGGNAQRRSRNIIFQHGSIPKRMDFALIQQVIKGNFDGMEERVMCLDTLTGGRLNLNEVTDIFVRSFSFCFGVDFLDYQFTEEEETMLKRLIKDKYSRDVWNFKNVQASLVE